MKTGKGVRSALALACLVSLQVHADALPQRWVSAGGALSEWVVALGGQPHLVGVDTTSQHPDALRQLPSVGYQRQLSSEGVLALHPDVLVGTEEMGPPPVLEQLRGAGVRVETFSAKAELPALDTNLKRLGELLGDAPAAARADAEFHQQLQAHQTWLKSVQAQAKAPGVLLLIGNAGGSLLVAGQGTLGDWVVQQAGAHNLASLPGYKALSSEAISGLDPQVIIVADRALLGDQARQALLRQNPALAGTQAAKDGRIVALDPTLLVGGIGPRVPQALSNLSAAFYPAAKPRTP
ncbi:MAG: Hemin-binding periplasmic protein HmuT [Stenotrophomonas maltophilia]|nr:MAG: Hemin-binding periplasmic protein HmuT [Stenotrophomonas maltophilia]